MKIALIAGGLIEIPPKESGAIETIIWNHKLNLETLGHEVIILNDKDLRAVAEKINNGNFDFVHLHYSEYTSFFLHALKMPFCSTCHSGYITNKKKWSIGYYSVFYDTLRCPGIIPLSDDIAKLYAKAGRRGFIRVLRNGIGVKKFSPREVGNGRAIYLGRIQPRKRQAWLANLLRGKNIPLDFVGVVDDDNFKINGDLQYKGSWTKEKVYEKLSEYSALVLLSEGEAAPLVVPEALAAGLSIVVSRSAAANLNEGLPFVSILPDELSDPEKIAQAINTQIQNNKIQRAEIVEYAQKYFDTGVVAADYVKIIEEFRSGERKAERIKIPLGKFSIYTISKLALFVKSLLRSKSSIS